MSSPFDNRLEIAWCPGCGNFGILNALKRSLVSLGLEPKQVVMVSGIGQAAKLPHYLQAHVFNGLHGRSIPVAFAIKTVNPNLTVIAESGDGCMYGEGGNHLLHTIRRNPNITVIVHDNQVYGLTKGQASPTSDFGFRSKIQPWGNLSLPFQPLSVAIAQGASWVARAFSGDLEGLSKIMQEAIAWEGFSLVDVLQPCVSFNRVNTYQWYQERVYYLEEDYDPTDRVSAFSRSLEWGDRIPLGIFYKEEKPTYQEKNPVFTQKKDLIYREIEKKDIWEEEKSHFI
ncbi:MAG: 2-oxoglutarate/2-oxoacid ferredoxin oxidoreductase subunit beta [Candidatus Atribacteria bacterium]|nr:2-oxoglutarate/2-oxoacid ferredoxin oxidoreductase subunit beta [Candidatus Atribacteria bacterium]